MYVCVFICKCIYIYAHVCGKRWLSWMNNVLPSQRAISGAVRARDTGMLAPLLSTFSTTSVLL